MEKLRILSKLERLDVQPKIPLVELAGHTRLLIENHTGVLSYSQEEITIRVCYGCLQITGQNMMLAEMTRDQLVISGMINGILVQRR